jgi:hypothetical protein
MLDLTSRRPSFFLQYVHYQRSPVWRLEQRIDFIPGMHHAGIISTLSFDIHVSQGVCFILWDAPSHVE